MQQEHQDVIHHLMPHSIGGWSAILMTVIFGIHITMPGIQVYTAVCGAVVGTFGVISYLIRIKRWVVKTYKGHGKEKH